MKKHGVLNHRISEVIASMGHGDMLVIADAGLPIPPGVERIDLAVGVGLPQVLPVLDVIAGELQIEKIVLADELRERNPALADAFVSRFPDAVTESRPHEGFKELSRRARAVIRTGECTPYANIILVSGVIF